MQIVSHTGFWVFYSFFLHPFFYNLFYLWLRKGQKLHSNRWKKESMKCILNALTSLVAETRDTGSFSVPTLPLPTQVYQAPFPWLLFTEKCSRLQQLPLLQIPYVSLSLFLFLLHSFKQRVIIFKRSFYAPFNSWMCIYCICWVVWECINWKWSKLSVGHIFPSLPLLFKHRNSSASLVIVNHHLCELLSYSHVFA